MALQACDPNYGGVFLLFCPRIKCACFGEIPIRHWVSVNDRKIVSSAHKMLKPDFLIPLIIFERFLFEQTKLPLSCQLGAPAGRRLHHRQA
jgi:hypothetical protein